MTLCIYRPERKLDARFVFELNDVNGLLKMMREAVAQMGEAGLASTPYYVGALLALEVLFGCAEADGKVDKWTDFMALFERSLEDLEGDD